MGFRVVSSAVRERALELAESGLSLHAVAVEIGCDRHTVSRWVRAAGYSTGRGGRIGIRLELPSRPPGVASGMLRQGHGRRFDGFDRAWIQIKHDEGFSGTAIARLLDCSPSSVTRELRRNRTPDGRYHARAAQISTDERRCRPRPRRVESNQALRAAVIAYLDDRFSPQQVAAQLRKDFPDREEMWLSHETIYQALYVQGRGALRQELAREKALRTGRTTRIPQSRAPKARGQSWVQGCNISTRPAEVKDRAVPGHWEGDLVVGTKNQSAVITLVERTSRLALLRRLPEAHDTTSVMPVLTEMIAGLPVIARKSLTWDQGPEMSSHTDLTVATDIKVFFCDPHSPWQRGSNENLNGLLRDFFPKGTDFKKIADEEIAEAQRLLNKRPRQTLNWLTPTEAFQQVLQHGALTT